MFNILMLKKRNDQKTQRELMVLRKKNSTGVQLESSIESFAKEVFAFYCGDIVPNEIKMSVKL